ncbi:unnamed protein product [Mytilus coruscus]|uniref:Uncharacterized protein n=1 Tax=Mytilus coruscus TaxID=42192 RepID=A0A6J7ZV25_MYTCO|nr:unnamed protein product [Mytilus coruscus]
MRYNGQVSDTSNDCYIDIQNAQQRNKCYRYCRVLVKKHTISLTVMVDFLLKNIDQNLRIVFKNNYLVLYYLLIISGIEQNPGPGDETSTKKKRVRKSGVLYKTYLTNRSSLEEVPNITQEVQAHKLESSIADDDVADKLDDEYLVESEESEESDIGSDEYSIDSDSEPDQESDKFSEDQIEDNFCDLQIYDGAQITLA